jgi:hypothetical protein
MIGPPPGVRVWLACGRTDMRNGMDPDDPAQLRQILLAAPDEIERQRLIIATLQRNRFGRRSEKLAEGAVQQGLEDLGLRLVPQPLDRLEHSLCAPPLFDRWLEGRGDRDVVPCRRVEASSRSLSASPNAAMASTGRHDARSVCPYSMPAVMTLRPCFARPRAARSKRRAQLNARRKISGARRPSGCVRGATKNGCEASDHPRPG